MYKNFTKTGFIGKISSFLPTCHSTNDIAARAASIDNCKEGTVFLTDFQENGKGQRGNSWESEAGKNILSSIVLRPEFLPVQDNFYLTVIFSLAVTDALSGLPVSDVKIKWPNDIYYKNNKIAGILIQNFLKGNGISATILGLGLNANQVVFEEPKAISLKNITGKTTDRSKLFESICVHLEKRLQQLIQHQHQVLLDEYLSRMYWINEVHVFKNNDGHFNGIIRGVGALGKLRMEMEDGDREFDLKEIEYIK